MFFKQIKHHGDNFSYVIADETTRKTAVIDPSYNADAITKTCKDNNLTVEYIIDTHGHGDHTSDNEVVKSRLSGKIVAHKSSTVKKDLAVVDGETITLGNLCIKVIHTPGHTPDSICLLTNGKLLTGDTLFVGECGRTDLAGGSAEDMYHSLFEKLMKIDDNVEVYPGHDYGSASHSTIGAEKRSNYTLEKRTLREFIDFMREP